MAANAAPRYTLVGDYSTNSTPTTSGTMGPVALTATGDFTGVSANHVKVFTGDTANGSRLGGLHFEAIGTNIQTVARIFVNNGGTPSTAGNNVLVGQLTLPATTTSNTTAVGSSDFTFPGAGGYADIPPGYTVWVGLGTTVGAGWEISPILGGKF
jgi:hypothetical protein